MKTKFVRFHARLFLGVTLVSESCASLATAATFTDANWTAVGSGMNAFVYALAVSNSGLYAGGEFSTAGGSAAKDMAKWDGNNWAALGGGMNYAVAALAVSGSDLYVGGKFTVATNSDGTVLTVNGVAKWNGSNWSALGSGMGGSAYSAVYALALSDTNLYVGGYFTSAGGRAANSVAKWDGSRWTALGSGVHLTFPNIPSVRAVAISGSDVYVGGYFTKAGDNPANYIAKWDGTNWSAVGEGMNDEVHTLAVSGNDLYAGGAFTMAGGIAVNHIAKWNGSSWSALGSGTGAPADYPYYVRVSSLAVSGADVYAGGQFTTAGGIAATNIAKWNGANWSPLGSGINGSVHVLAVSGSDLFVGGLFNLAGGKVSACVARAYLLDLPTLSMLRSGLDVMVSWPSRDTAGFALEQAAVVATPSNWITNSAPVTDDGTNKSVTIPATNGAQFFRLRRP